MPLPVAGVTVLAVLSTSSPRRGHRLQTRRARGFSMIELLVVLSLIGITASLAIPSLSQVARTYRSSDQANELLNAVRAARSLAQKTNAPVRLTAAPGQMILSRATFTGSVDGLLIAVDTNN